MYASGVNHAAQNCIDRRVRIHHGQLWLGPDRQPVSKSGAIRRPTILSTPTASLPTPAPSAGISDAGRAGISLNNENNTVPASETVEPANGTINTTAGADNTALPSGATPANDLAPSTSVGESLAAPASTMSVAEISSRYKANKGTQNARTLTNDDVQRLLTNRTGVTMARNMPPLEQECGGQRDEDRGFAERAGAEFSAANERVGQLSSAGCPKQRFRSPAGTDVSREQQQTRPLRLAQARLAREQRDECNYTTDQSEPAIERCCGRHEAAGNCDIFAAAGSAGTGEWRNRTVGPGRSPERKSTGRFRAANERDQRGSLAGYFFAPELRIHEKSEAKQQPR